MTRLPVLLLLVVACAPPPRMVSLARTDCPAVEQARVRGVRWIAPRDPAVRRTNLAWCRATGAVLMIPPPAVATGDTLGVLSWNVNAGGGELTAVLHEALGLPCDGMPVRRPVIALLQEAYRAGEGFPARGDGLRAQRPAPEGPHRADRADVRHAARVCGLGLFYVPAVRNGWGRGEDGFEDRGNAILSSIPLTDPAVIVLTPESARRLVAVASVEFNELTVRVATTHFTTLPLPWRMLTTGNSSRVLQVEALLGGLGDLGATAITLVTGDFNSWSVHEGAIRILQARFPDSPAPLEDTRGPYPTDHVFLHARVSGLHVVPGSYRLLDGTRGSDHAPIVFRLAR